MKRLLIILGAMLGVSACGGKAIIDGEPTTSTSTTTSTSGGGNVGGGSLESITLEKAFVFADCFPGGANELDVELSLTLENAGSAAVEVELVEVRLQGEAGLTSFPVSPAAVTVPAATTQTYDFVKSGPGIGTRGCDWCTPTNTQLVVELLVDGVSRAFTDGIDSVSCAF